MKTVTRFTHSADQLATAAVAMIATNAVREPFGDLVPTFERATGTAVAVSFGGTLDIVARVEGGETADIVIVPDTRVDALRDRGLVAARTDLVRSGIGVAARVDLPAPDISSVAALTAALRAAGSIVLSSGPSSFYLPGLFERLGIADEVTPKIIRIAPGLGVGATLAGGAGDIGFTQMSELMSVAGIQYLGPLPAAVQHHTVFSAGVHADAGDAARALLAYLGGRDAVTVLRRHGLEPATRTGAAAD